MEEPQCCRRFDDTSNKQAASRTIQSKVTCGDRRCVGGNNQPGDARNTNVFGALHGPQATCSRNGDCQDRDCQRYNDQHTLPARISGIIKNKKQHVIADQNGTSDKHGHSDCVELHRRPHRPQKLRFPFSCKGSGAARPNEIRQPKNQRVG